MLPGGQSIGWEQDSGRVEEISNIFYFFANPPRQACKVQPTLTDYVNIAPNPSKNP